MLPRVSPHQATMEHHLFFRHKGREKPPGHHARPFLGLLEGSEMRWIIDRAFSVEHHLSLSLSWAWGRVSVPGLQSPPTTLSGSAGSEKRM